MRGREGEDPGRQESGRSALEEGSSEQKNSGDRRQSSQQCWEADGDLSRTENSACDPDQDGVKDVVIGDRVGADNLPVRLGGKRLPGKCLVVVEIGVQTVKPKGQRCGHRRQQEHGLGRGKCDA